MSLYFATRNIANYIHTTAELSDRAHSASMFCWIRWTTNDNNVDYAMHWGDGTGTGGSNRQYWSLSLSAGSAANRDRARAGERNEGGEDFAISSAQTSADTWHAIGGIFRASGTNSVYLDGTKTDNGGTGTGLGAQDAVIIGFGASINATPDSPWQGWIAHGAAWTSDIGDAAMTSLANGVNPLAIDPGNLIFYHSLTHKQASDFWEPMTEVGTISYSGLMPPVAPLLRPMYHAPITPAAAVGGGLPPDGIAHRGILGLGQIDGAMIG